MAKRWCPNLTRRLHLHHRLCLAMTPSPVSWGGHLPRPLPALTRPTPVHHTFSSRRYNTIYAHPVCRLRWQPGHFRARSQRRRVLRPVCSQPAVLEGGLLPERVVSWLSSKLGLIISSIKPLPLPLQLLQGQHHLGLLQRGPRLGVASWARPYPARPHPGAACH